MFAPVSSRANGARSSNLCCVAPSPHRDRLTSLAVQAMHRVHLRPMRWASERLAWSLLLAFKNATGNYDASRCYCKWRSIKQAWSRRCMEVLRRLHAHNMQVPTPRLAFEPQYSQSSLFKEGKKSVSAGLLVFAPSRRRCLHALKSMINVR